MVAAEKIRIVSADERRGKETLVTMLIPDLTESDRQIAALKDRIAEDQAAGKAKAGEIESLKSDQEFAKYLALYERIKSGAIKLTAEQAGNWRKLMEKHARTAGQLAKFDAERKALDLSAMEAEKELIRIQRERDAMGEGISCEIDKVAGHVIGQTMRATRGIEVFNGLPANEVRVLLQKMDGQKARVFSGDSGSVSWQFEK